MAEIKWKTQEEIEEEQRNSQLSDVEKLQQENEMLAMAIMELSTLILEGEK